MSNPRIIAPAFATVTRRLLVLRTLHLTGPTTLERRQDPAGSLVADGESSTSALGAVVGACVWRLRPGRDGKSVSFDLFLQR